MNSSIRFALVLAGLVLAASAPVRAEAASIAGLNSPEEQLRPSTTQNPTAPAYTRTRQHELATTGDMKNTEAGNEIALPSIRTYDIAVKKAVATRSLKDTPRIDARPSKSRARALDNSEDHHKRAPAWPMTPEHVVLRVA